MHFDPEKMKAVVTTELPIGNFGVFHSLEDFASGNSIVPKQTNESAKIKRGRKTYVTSRIDVKNYEVDFNMISWAGDCEYLSLLEKDGARFSFMLTYGTKIICNFQDCMIQKMPDGDGFGDGEDTGNMTFPVIVGKGFYHTVAADE